MTDLDDYNIDPQDESQNLDAVTVDQPEVMHVAASGTEGSVDKRVAYALKQVGKQYQWGAVGPQAFDCSGLVMMAYAQIGVELLHNSGLQAAWFQRRGLLKAFNTDNRSKLQAGDVVFWYGSIATPHSITHCGLYIGKQDNTWQCVAAVDEQYGVIQHRMAWALNPCGFGFWHK